MSLCRHFEGDSHQRQVQTPEADLQTHLYYPPSAAEEATRRTLERHGGFLAATAKAQSSAEQCRRGPAAERLLAGQRGLCSDADVAQDSQARSTANDTVIWRWAEPAGCLAGQHDPH